MANQYIRRYDNIEKQSDQQYPTKSLRTNVNSWIGSINTL